MTEPCSHLRERELEKFIVCRIFQWLVKFNARLLQPFTKEVIVRSTQFFVSIAYKMLDIVGTPL